jgi:hypothetical protein
MRCVDDHYPLINSVYLEGMLNRPDNRDERWCAHSLIRIHNTTIRALNAAWNQAVLVQPLTQEAENFLFFNKQLCFALHRHQHFLDEYLLRRFESMLNRPTAVEGISETSRTFILGLDAFQQYLFTTEPAEYDGATLRLIINSFGPGLVQFLHGQIRMLTDLGIAGSHASVKAWKESWRSVIRQADLYSWGPWMLGCYDSAFEVDGEKERPREFSWARRVVIRSWYARKYSVAWRFCPSDFVGSKRHFLSV